MGLTNEIIKKRLVEKFSEVYNFDEPYGMLTFAAPREMNLKVMQFLYDDPELRFQFLTDVFAVHYPDKIALLYAVSS